MDGVESVVSTVQEAKKYPNIAAVEDYLGGIGRVKFEDGTVQFARMDTYPDVVYSPRLIPHQLEVFCKRNLDRYRQYCEQLIEAALFKQPDPPIERFWEENPWIRTRN